MFPAIFSWTLRRYPGSFLVRASTTVRDTDTRVWSKSARRAAAYTCWDGVVLLPTISRIGQARMCDPDRIMHNRRTSNVAPVSHFMVVSEIV